MRLIGLRGFRCWKTGERSFPTTSSLGSLVNSQICSIFFCRSRHSPPVFETIVKCVCKYLNLVGTRGLQLELIELDEDMGIMRKLDWDLLQAPSYQIMSLYLLASEKAQIKQV